MRSIIGAGILMLGIGCHSIPPEDDEVQFDYMVQDNYAVQEDISITRTPINIHPDCISDVIGCEKFVDSGAWVKFAGVMCLTEELDEERGVYVEKMYFGEDDSSKRWLWYEVEPILEVNEERFKEYCSDSLKNYNLFRD
jgi:hypothetical protein